ncbi:hypothetical protein BFP76_00090 [Amylibacter kogurei]|uniref:Ferredoxin reductase n=1 Tax=Paramylibacter kogurei TaxID=1889778 RepID=A0A2G5K9L3_9RHOB|nr:FAD-dependent oxidoreductase [Amylibacter kogurei]PIB25580.1 hypothetical protein BFP76_00090 [Amylibacter kogurei]
MGGVVIIGAGECGVRIAFSLRERGYDGEITLLTDEPNLPYERPPLSKGNGSEPKLIKNADAFVDENITLKRATTVVSVDRNSRQISLNDGSIQHYETLVFATGARARLFAGMKECLTLRSDTDLDEISPFLKPDKTIGIIGGGFIGLELAATARNAGANVTLIEAAPRILGRGVPEPISQIVHAEHVKNGVKIITGMGVNACDRTSITLTDGTQIKADVVIAGVGSVPNTELAQSTGLDVENGIVVDDHFRTSDPNIFAAGDCCNFTWQGVRVRLESWKAAQDQGAHVAGAIMGEQGEYTDVPWFWSDQYDLTMQVAGLFELDAEIHHRHSTENKCVLFQCDASGVLTAAAGIGVGNEIAKDIRILEKLIQRGAIVVSSELIDETFNLKRLLKSA